MGRLDPRGTESGKEEHKKAGTSPTWSAAIASRIPSFALKDSFLLLYPSNRNRQAHSRYSPLLESQLIRNYNYTWKNLFTSLATRLMSDGITDDRSLAKVTLKSHHSLLAVIFCISFLWPMSQITTNLVA